MVFSSPIFLFGFLPVALFLYYLSPRQLKNITLLLLSLLFYAWGEVFYIAVMLTSITANYFVGILLQKTQAKYSGEMSLPALFIGIAINIGLLVSFKYANFIVDNVNGVLALAAITPRHLEPVHLPLGISFFTFQAISYIVDVYRREVPAQANPVNLALYISLFPQLIAGPIVRYHDVARQIVGRTHSPELVASGIQRFVVGLAKKMLIANPLGEFADNVFLLPGQDLTMPLAWLGILAYTLQIYFDFSGYSDMAIGLGRMFGFKFLENFNYPYISTSIREFWRRWHISLSSWFRDYVYIPLGGSRVPTVRVYLNLLLVFLLTGVWHGASWNFIVWGFCHGFFLALEHAGFSRILERAWRPLQHVYVLLVVILAWVLFRAESLTQAMDYFTVMLDITRFDTTPLMLARVSSSETPTIFILGVIFTMPVYRWFANYLQSISGDLLFKRSNVFSMQALKLIGIASLLFLSVLKVASSTYNPFIYFRF